MCGKCKDIDNRIAHFGELSKRVFDKQTLDGIAAVIAELEGQKRELHPEQKPESFA